MNYPIVTGDIAQADQLQEYVAIVRELAENEPILDTGGSYGVEVWVCALCGGDDGVREVGAVVHKDSCPFRRSRALYPDSEAST